MKITREGYTQLENKMATYKEQRKEALSEIGIAQEQETEVAENGALNSAVNKLKVINNNIDGLNELFRKAEVVDVVSRHGELGIGATVTVEDEYGDELELQIVSDGLSDPLADKVSFGSPIIQACIGVEIGDRFSVTVAGNEIYYRLVSIYMTEKFSIVGEIATGSVVKQFLKLAEKNAQFSMA